MFQLGISSGTGRSIRDYRLGRLLGRGGFGYVYEANLLATTSASSGSQTVAIKMIDKKAVEQSRMIERVRNEVYLHSQIKHPSILELFDYFEDESFVYLVMEICRNGELYRYLQRRSKTNSGEGMAVGKENSFNQPSGSNPQTGSSLGTLTEPEARGVMLQIINGLIYLHGQGIIHRDLKLSNLLLTENNDVKIADFGLAVRSAHPEGEQKTMCGTPNYISPEIVSRQPYGLASDIWSLGCMLYTILVGAAPFESGAVKNTLDKVSRVDYAMPNHLSRESQSIIREMLQKDPRSRITLPNLLKHPFFQRSFCRLPPSVAYSGAKVSSAHKNVTNLFPLEALSTERLRSISKRTKHALVEIDTSGQLILDFDGDKYRMVISSDGDTIQFFANAENNNYAAKMPLRSYLLAQLPQKFWKKYQYACRFIDAVRAKTPKIIFYSPQAKCMFMENGPMPNFEVNFYQGIKIVWEVCKGHLELRLSDSSASAREGEKQERPPQVFEIGKPENSASISYIALPLGSAASITALNLWKHTLECYRQCLSIADNPTNESFPLVLKSSSTSMSSVTTVPPTVSGDSFSKPPSIYMSEVSSVGSGVSLSSTTRSFVQQPATPAHSDGRPSRPTSAGQLQIAKSSAGRPPIPPSPTSMQRPPVPPSPSLAVESKPQPPAAELAARKNTSRRSLDWSDSKYLDGVGWCIQQVAEESAESLNELPKRFDYFILFNDGARLVVESPESAESEACYLRFAPSPTQRPERHIIDRLLPTAVKTRLAYFPRFIQLYDNDDFK